MNLLFIKYNGKMNIVMLQLLLANFSFANFLFHIRVMLAFDKKYFITDGDALADHLVFLATLASVLSN